MSADTTSTGHNWRFNQKDYEKKFGDRIAHLESEVRILRRKNEDLEIRARKGDHFTMLMRAVHENQLVKKEWERFMMSLRMTGYDE